MKFAPVPPASWICPLPTSCCTRNQNSCEAEAWIVSSFEFSHPHSLTDKRSLTNTYWLLSKVTKSSQPPPAKGLDQQHVCQRRVSWSTWDHASLTSTVGWAVTGVGGPSSHSIYQVLTLTQQWARPCRAVMNKTSMVSALRQVSSAGKDASVNTH